MANKTAKGYRREYFEDAWSRYLADSGAPDVTPVTTAYSSHKRGVSEASHDPPCDASKEAENPHEQAIVTDVPFGERVKRDNGTFDDSETEREAAELGLDSIYDDGAWR